jgi:RluA family pseudouridine synthase
MRFVVQEEATLLKILQKITENRFSVREIKHALEQNRCRVNSQVERFGSRRLYAGDQIDLIEFTKEDLKPSRFTFEQERVLFEDDALLVYNKPVGLPSIGHGLFEFLKKEKKSLYAVHRLDKDTSGVIAFAKTKQEEERLLKAFKERSVLKAYLAIVQGRLIPKKGSLTSRLGKVGEFHGQTIMGKTEKGQMAITEWEVLKEHKEASLVQLNPKTGRTHQLRCHMASLGHPLIGDVQYGWKASRNFYPRSFFLHAALLELSGQKFTAPLPPAFVNAVEFLFQGSPQ